ncbi:unnamed protein product [Brassicogethes aeneus]|uniref:Uncharacterized protein n=1 Tax=Brassicogethes aeneus TaxID=1431903 RepID=A0A9P0B739_BRAAE|nr:unnamed protein product [Brassicogethes aeneus]
MRNNPVQTLLADLVKAFQSQRSGEQIDLPPFRSKVTESTKRVSNVEIAVDRHNFCSLIETGADLSFISEKYLALFKDKVVSCNVMLKGISSITITTTNKFTGSTRISGVDTIVIYVFLPDECLDYDVFIGRNLFEDESLVTITDYQGSRVIRRNLPGINLLSSSRHPSCSGKPNV